MLGKGKYTEKLPFDLSAINVKLELDSQARDYLSKRRQQFREADLARNAQQLTTAKAEEESLRQLYDHQAQHTQNKHELEMDKLRAQYQLELEKQRAQNALDIQKMRVEVYKPLVQGGMWDMLLLRLGENPGDVAQVSDLIMQMHARQLLADVAVLEAMIKDDRIEDRHLKDVMADLVRRLRTGAGASLPTLSATEPKQLPSDQTDPGGKANNASAPAAAEVA